MKEFDGIIGYDRLKKELATILAVLKDPERFRKLGASLPKGLFLHGEPGVGKTMLAEAFIKASGRQCYSVSRNSDATAFLNQLSALFAEAKKNAPSLVFLDDLDKYATQKSDEEPYNLLQSLIDSVKNDDVFVVATANELRYLPASLLREGRFDKVLKVAMPSETDAALLLKHFLAEKPCATLNEEDIEAMSSFRSCAEIKTLINEAAIRAAYAGHSALTMEDIVASYLAGQDGQDEPRESHNKKEVAIHEVGHLLLNEACLPGSVGFVSVEPNGGMEGYCRMRHSLSRRPHSILVSLAGKAAAETLLGRLASGTSSDLSNARGDVLDGLRYTATGGMTFLGYGDELESSNAIPDERQKGAVSYEMEWFLAKDKEMVTKNRAFVEEASKRLLKKGYLLASDIAALKKAHPIDRGPIRGI